jgi:hypothetical protein
MNEPSKINEADPPKEKGLECPKCGCRHFFVVYTDPQAKRIVRRRECRHCGRRITTVEKHIGP